MRHESEWLLGELLATPPSTVWPLASVVMGCWEFCAVFEQEVVLLLFFCVAMSNGVFASS